MIFNMIDQRSSESEDDIGDLNEEDMIYVGDADDFLNAMEEEDLAESEEEFDPPRNDAHVVLVHPEDKSAFCVAIHPDKHIYAVGTEADKMFIWGQDETVKATYDFSDSVIVTEFSPEGTYLAAADMAGNIKVLNITTEPYEMVFEYAIGDLQFMFWHRKAKVLFAGSVTGDIYVFKIPNGDCKILAGHGQKVNAATIMHDGIRLVAGYEDGAVKIWDVRSCTVQNQVCTESAVMAIDAHIENNLIMVGTDNGTMSLINASNAKILTSLSLGSDSVESVLFYNNPEFNVAAIGGLDGTILIWDVTRNVVRHKIPVESGISCLRWTDGAKLISGHLDAIARQHDAKSGKTLKEYMGHKRAIFDLVVSPDNKWFLTASDDSTAMIFEVDKNEP